VTTICIYLENTQCVDECKEECLNYDLCFKIYNSLIKANGHAKAKLY